MPIEPEGSIRTDETITSAPRPAEQLVRTGAGRPVPRTSPEAGFEQEARARLARRERARRRLGRALGALGLAAFGAIIALLARHGGSRASLQTVMHDFGYVVAERKGIGIDR
ncbi:MAG: hypothetical protein VXW31_07765 [Planctomycetota bacterium]|nr:hypothetical protein [Planctomycetota bacterium]